MVTAISIVLIITALILIVTVLLQSSDEDGIGALSGSAYVHSVGRLSVGLQLPLALARALALGTKIAAGLFVMLSVLLLIVK